MKKNALVVSGGGSKGAFAVGAIDHIVNKLGVRFHFVSGTSTGSLIAPLVVTGEIDELIRIYTSVRTRDILTRRELADALRANSLFDVTPLNDLIRSELTPARTDVIFASPMQMAITTVCLQTGRVTYFQTGPSLVSTQDADVIPIRDRETFFRAVLGSADQPALMPPIMIPPGADPPRQYVDGGVREYAPIRIAIDNGATDIYAILLSPERRETDNSRFQGIANILLRTIGLFVEDVGENDVGTARLYNDSILYLRAVRERLAALGLDEATIDDVLSPPGRPNPFAGKRAVNLHVVAPEGPLPTDGLTFDPEIMRQMMVTGRQRAAALLGSTPT